MLSLLLLAAPASFAQEGGLEDGSLDFDIGDDIGGPEAMTYTGGLTEKAPGYVAGKPVTINHSGGNVSVRCQDAEGISAQLKYSLEGHDGPALENMGRGIGLRAWGDSNGGGIQSTVPWKPASIADAEVPLIVTLPRQADVNVTNRGGWIEVLNCDGKVTANTDQGGVFASGVITGFNASSSTGDITIKGKDGSEIKSNSSAVASTGDVKVNLPLTISGQLSATGARVNVYHTVDGNVSESSVAGAIGSGGPAIRLQAKGDVEMSTP